jgi:alkyldihydroxyacetonephosphate synthase
MTVEHVETVEHMKWWGWGEPGLSFSHRDKPKLAPFVRAKVGLDLDRPGAPAPTLESLDVRPSQVGKGLLEALVEAVGAEHVRDDRLERVVHAYGKSLRDLLRLRAGDVGRLPDVVVYPGSEGEVSLVLAATEAADAVVVPFGGGTNISGSLEPPRSESRPVVSVDLGRLDRLLDVDAEAQLARVQAGVRGPSLEAQLGAAGWTMGHFPDSFTHSTLGGWIATRSSGMQSDRYGDISEITRAVRVVTPVGILATRPMPASSTGPSVREMILGSEGRLGIITEATVQVHRIPEERVILGYFFPTWSAGLAAMAELAASDATPSLTRVSDANETQFSLATAKAGSLRSKLESAALKAYLRRVKKFDLDQACLSFIGFEGGAAHVKAQRKAVGRIVAGHRGVCVGPGPGRLYDQKKFDTPYIRDYLLERGGLADVSETAAPWSRLVELHNRVGDSARKAFAEIGVTGWIMCHLSHSYHSGACLYFTFAFKPAGAPAAGGVAGAALVPVGGSGGVAGEAEGEAGEALAGGAAGALAGGAAGALAGGAAGALAGGAAGALAQYDRVKSAVQQAFVDHGATLSHHHGVGVEHARWLAEDISPAGVTMIRALFEGIDPEGRLNPGKIVPS